MFKQLERLTIALIFALLAAGGTLMVANAQDVTPPAPAPQANQNCAGCHADYEMSLESGLHGQAGSDPVFMQAWTDQGQPGACLICHNTGYDPVTGISEADSITCAACHSPVPANHPTENMPVDKSTDLCGKCHSDSRFASNNWTMSSHYQRAMTCSVCHNPHSAGMKTVEGVSTSAEDASDLCHNCHKDAMQNFPSSKHAEAGVTCVNCHLGFNVGDTDTTANFADAHKAPDHSFMPTLTTCNKCHSTQMHAPGQSVAAAAIKIEEAGGTPTPGPTPVAFATQPVTDEPSAVSPVGYAGLAGLVGLAAGMVLAPWLERFYHRVSKHHHEEETHE